MTSPDRCRPLVETEVAIRTMTIGDLARRTGVPVKVLRRHEDMGLIHTLGRSPAGYRLFGEDALWCVETIRTLRSLGLTEAEIRHLAHSAESNDEGCQLLGPQLAEILSAASAPAPRPASGSSNSCSGGWRTSSGATGPRWKAAPWPIPWGPGPRRAEAGLDSPTGGRP